MLPLSLQSRLPAIRDWLFAGIFFFMPGHVAPAYSLTGMLLIVLIAEGDFAGKWARLRQDPLFWIFQAFFWIVPLSLLWTADMTTGWRMVGRYVFFLLAPLYLLVARRELWPRCLVMFLAGCAMAEVLAYYNWIQMVVFPGLPRGIRVFKEAEDTAPFVDHILYAPILAWAAYLALRESLAGPLARRAGYAVLAAATVGNLIFSGGRAGQLTFLVLLALFVFQRFAGRPLRAFLVATSLIGGLATFAYNTNAYLESRVDMAINEASRRHDATNTSVALRLNFLANSLRLVAEQPLFGVGAGDFTVEYERINARLTPGWLSTDNPHNQYLFVLTTTGVAGGVILLLTYWPPILWRRRRDALAPTRIGLAVFIATCSFFEDYLWRSNTSLLFVAFATVLWGQASLGPPPDEDGSPRA